ncbi:MAG: hypothetical protein JNK12_16490 [Acidimicrobiales bacterium]|nr:hypothetical protein [Acidimicrobiales bacterium]
MDDLGPDEAAEAAVDAAYEWHREAVSEHDRAVPPAPGTPAPEILAMSFDEMMAAPRVELLDWSGSTLQTDELAAEKLSRPIDFHLVDPAFDELPGSHAFDFVYYHLFSYYDHLVRRILFEYPDRGEVVSHVSRRIFPFDIDRYIERYGLVAPRAESGNEAAQSNLFALMMWMSYVGCVTLTIPTAYPNDGVDPGVLAGARAKALESLGGLSSWLVYAQTDLQYAIAFMLRRGAEAVAFGLLGDVAGRSQIGPAQQSAVNVHFHSVVASQIQLASTEGMAVDMSGDRIQAGEGSTVVNRSAITSSFNSVSDSGLREDLERLIAVVESAGDAEAAELTEALVAEAVGPKRRSVLRPLWSRIQEIVPTVGAAVTVGSKLSELLS